MAPAPSSSRFKRDPALPKKVEEIDPEQDVRVRLLGTVIGKEEDSIVLDDGSGSVEVFLDEEDLKSIEEKNKIRILGRVLPTPESFEIQGELVQEMDDLDLEFYNKAMKKLKDEGMFEGEIDV